MTEVSDWILLMKFQGYLMTSTVDYMATDPHSLLFCWILLILGYVLPNVTIFFSHISINSLYRWWSIKDYSILIYRDIKWFSDFSIYYVYFLFHGLVNYPFNVDYILLYFSEETGFRHFYKIKVLAVASVMFRRWRIRGQN